MATTQPATTPETPISVKVLYNGVTRRCKLPLKDLTATIFPLKVKEFLGIPQGIALELERYSDSASNYVTLDPNNIQVYKTLVRAAKAKLKLRIRASLPRNPDILQTSGPSATQPAAVTAPGGLPLRPASQSFKPAAEQSEAPRKSIGQQMADARLAARRQHAPMSANPAQDEQLMNRLLKLSRDRELALRMKAGPSMGNVCAWSVYCNKCDKPMENDHYHCSVCDHGDFDLCEPCVEAGAHCPGEDHWLIKRVVKNGTVINSMTKTIAPKLKGKGKAPEVPPAPSAVPVAVMEPAEGMPGAFTEEKPSTTEATTATEKLLYDLVKECSRICNCCIEEFPDSAVLSCKDCPDFDLCKHCHGRNNHGHHPEHRFVPAIEDETSPAQPMQNNGLRHAAICDGCDKHIFGVRHKCLNCPDWDLCSACLPNAKFIHPDHRFVPIYGRLTESTTQVRVRHSGIFCDGPLCNAKNPSRTYIIGVRYKCAVCHDTDFCAGCEASPHNRHNRTHPLIMFKSPVKNVSVTTLNQDRKSQRTVTLGDKPARSLATPAVDTRSDKPSASSTTKVRTVANLDPTPKKSHRPVEKISIKDLLSEPVDDKISSKDVLQPFPKNAYQPSMKSTDDKQSQNTDDTLVDREADRAIDAMALDAHYQANSISDGTLVGPTQLFVQSWTLKNTGPASWPVGCAVRYVGGHNMFNIDNSHPFSTDEINKATSSQSLSEEIKPGEEFQFSVLMKAPQREGPAISYWRLKTTEGLAFGHTLWCHIVVRKAPADNATEAVKAPEIELPAIKEQKISKKVNEAETKPDQSSSDTLSSQMIFPTLDKESPVPSVHEAASNIASAASGSEPTAADNGVTVEPLTAEDIGELLKDEFDDEDWSDDDDGFVTDEEWDILGTSDEE